jgi:hypothetical protein
MSKKYFGVAQIKEDNYGFYLTSVSRTGNSEEQVLRKLRNAIKEQDLI